MKVVAKRVAPAVYELRGVLHTLPVNGCGAACGGRVFAERFPPQQDDEVIDGRTVPYTIPASWECYCERCGTCDPNGWATLRECRREAPGYFGVPAPDPPA